MKICPSGPSDSFKCLARDFPIIVGLNSLFGSKSDDDEDEDVDMESDGVLFVPPTSNG